jgi:hypothetical protein
MLDATHSSIYISVFRFYEELHKILGLALNGETQFFFEASTIELEICMTLQNSYKILGLALRTQFFFEADTIELEICMTLQTNTIHIYISKIKCICIFLIRNGDYLIGEHKKL